MYNYQKFLSVVCAGMLVLGLSSVPVRVKASEAVTQTRTTVQVKGVVLDSDGQPVVGAGVIEVGTQGNGTITGADGSFTLITLPTISVFSMMSFADSSRF